MGPSLQILTTSCSPSILRKCQRVRACAIHRSIMASHGDTDVLFDIRTALYTGNYQQCITEAQKLKVRVFMIMVLKNLVGYHLTLLFKSASALHCLTNK